MSQFYPPELKQLYRQKRILPFIGAGASMSLSWRDNDGKDQKGPSWEEMVDEACKMLGYEEPALLRMRGTDLQILEYFDEKKGNFAPLTNWLVRHMNVPDKAISESILHTALSEMKMSEIFYTTNYDDFLERSLRLGGRSVQVVTGERDMGSNSSDVEVTKFHGDFNAPDEMVFSEGHYYRRMRLDSPLDLKLRSDLLGRIALFIGYSFRDMNIGYIFDKLNSLPNHSNNKRAYIVVHNPSDFEFTLFRKRKMEIIPTYGDDRTKALVDILRDIIS